LIRLLAEWRYRSGRRPAARRREERERHPLPASEFLPGKIFSLQI
jgi:hypothetical protein